MLIIPLKGLFVSFYKHSVQMLTLIRDDFDYHNLHGLFTLSKICRIRQRKFLNTQKLYSVLFSIRHFLNHKNDWCKLKMIHILPIFASFVTREKKIR